jgi:hypothetical protein
VKAFEFSGALWDVCRGSRGRQAFVFARFPNNLGMIAFHIFQAIPFLYELRELLDWQAGLHPK